ncbi:MAG: HNH endonuclease [Caldilineaceae bacterium]
MDRSYLSAALRAGVIADAGNRCGYCHSAEVLTGAPLEFDHIVPLAAGGSNTRENLWRICHRCNQYKGAQTHAKDDSSGEFVRIFNPRTQEWMEHFQWNADFTIIIGTTPIGRATVHALQLNRHLLVKARRNWSLTGWVPE